MSSRTSELDSHLPADDAGIRRALEESEFRLRTILNAASVVMWAVDAEGVFTFSEGRLLEQLGLKGGEVVGQSIYDVYSEFDQILEDNRRALRGDEFSSVTDVGGITFEARYTPFRDEAGQVKGVIGFAVDVTERIEAEFEQDRMVSLLRATLESTADGILVVDRQGGISTSNRSFAEMWGISEDVMESGDDDQAIGYVLAQLADPEAFVDKVKYLYENPEETSSDVLHFRDGRIFERYSQPQRVDDEIVGRVWSFRDVTQRRRAETDLLRRERQLEHAQHLAGFGSWEIDVGDGTVTRSDELYRIYGIESSIMEPTLQAYLDIVHEDDREAVAEAIRCCVETGLPFDYFDRIIRPDGEVRSLHSQGEAFRDPDGRIVRILAACDDVTEQREAEEVLRRSRDELERLVGDRTSELAHTNAILEEEIADRERMEDELRRSTAEMEGIFHALPDIYFRLSREGEILAHRSGGNASIGLPSGSYIGERIQELLPESAARALDAAFSKLRKTGSPTMAEFILPTEIGECYFEARILPHLDDEIVTIIRDITDRHDAEVALRTSEEHFRRLIENSSDVATIVAPDGTNLYQSPSIEYVLGRPSDEMLGQSAFELVHPDDVVHSQAALDWVANHPGETKALEFRYRHGDGSWRTLEARARTLLPESASAGIVINTRDVTERKLYEDALEVAKTEADTANRAKSDFLSRMSHELRTPMNSILGFAQLLARRDLPDDQRKSVDHILKAGRHLLVLINEVLEISRIESGRQNMSLEPVEVHAVLVEAASLVQPLAVERGITIRDCEVEGGLFVRADRQRLIQVLLNLLANAVKYNRERGSIELVCDLTLREDGKIRLGVSDTGPGISEEHRDRLFVPFERLAAERSDVEGTGLGLALCKRLTEAMDGSISFDSVVGEGTTFWVTLNGAEDPTLGNPRPAGRRIAPSATAAGDHAKILYIEDNLPNLALIESILEDRPGIGLLSALQGKMGVYLAGQHQPDLILLDLHLPDIPGQAVLRQLKDAELTREIPVVVVSADATQSVIADLLDAGASAYLTKPLDVGEFIDVLERFIVTAEQD